MKFYIVSSLVNYEQVRDLSRLLSAETLMSVGEKEYEGIKEKNPEYSQG